MTATNEAKQAINDRFITQWGGETGIALPNEEFTMVDGEAWVRLTVLHVDAFQGTLGKIGNRKYQRHGLILVNVFTPIETGTYDGDRLAEKARDIFEGFTFNGVTVNNSRIREKGVEDQWYHTIFEADFVYYEIK